MFESIIFLFKTSKTQCTHKIYENNKEFRHVEHTRPKKKTTTSFIFFKSVNEIKIRGKKRKKNQVDARRGKMMVQPRKNQQKEGGRKRGKANGKKGRKKK
jgi:hypothetical protein